MDPKLSEAMRLKIEAARRARGWDKPRTYILLSSDEAAFCADVLIQESSPFSLEPLPDDEWKLRAKDSLAYLLERRLGRELGEGSGPAYSSEIDPENRWT